MNETVFNNLFGETTTKRVVAEIRHKFGIVTSIVIIEDNAEHLRCAYAIGKKIDDRYKLKIISEREYKLA